jgi:hypothetical protein
MPIRFRADYAEHAGATLVLKVPQDVERRLARPGDDLYRAVLVLHDDRLCLLSLEAGAVVRQTVPLDGIGAISHSKVLLWGNLLLSLVDGSSFTFTYNTASAPLIEELIDVLRRRIAGPGILCPGVPRTPVVPKNFFLRRQFEAWGARSPSHWPIFSDDPGARRKPPGLLVFASGEEFTFLSLKGGPGARAGSPYASTTVHVLRKALQGVFLGPEPREHWGRAVRTLELRVGASRLEFSIGTDPESLAKLLQTAAAESSDQR